MNDSPCIYECRLIPYNDTEVCQACGRLIDEIRSWKDMDIDDKERIFKTANERLLQKLAKN